MLESGQPQNQYENKNFEGKFILLKTSDGTFGILRSIENADELINVISKNVQVFSDQRILRRRNVNFVKIKSNEKEYNLVVKGRLINNVMPFTTSFPKISEDDNFSLIKNQSEKVKFSVMNELLINKKAAELYNKRFNKELKIENPLGFFIDSRDNRGARWAIFEEIPNVLSEGNLDPRVLKNNIMKINNEMTLIGIRNNAYAKTEFDIVVAGEPANPSFFLVDSEDWILVK